MSLKVDGKFYIFKQYCSQAHRPYKTINFFDCNFARCSRNLKIVHQQSQQ